MNVKEFENKRWTMDDQKIFFRHRAALELVLNERCSSVLDFGCGDGLFLSMLRDKGIVGKGLDISEEGVRKALTKGLQASVFDFKDDIPPDIGKFDSVMILDVLEHVYDPSRLLAQAIKVASKSVIVGVPNFSSLPARLQVLFGKVPENNKPNKGHIFWFTYNVLKELAKANGLEITEARFNTLMQDRPIIGKIFTYLAERWPSLFALSFVVKMKRRV